MTRILALARNLAGWLLRPPSCPCCRFAQETHLGLTDDDS